MDSTKETQLQKLKKEIEEICSKNRFTFNKIQFPYTWFKNDEVEIVQVDENTIEERWSVTQKRIMFKLTSNNSKNKEEENVYGSEFEIGSGFRQILPCRS